MLLPIVLTVAGEDPPPNPHPTPLRHIWSAFFFFFFFGLRSLNVWAKTGVQQCRVSQRQVEALESSELFFKHLQLLQTVVTVQLAHLPDRRESSKCLFSCPTAVFERTVGSCVVERCSGGKVLISPLSSWDRYQPIHHS